MLRGKRRVRAHRVLGFLQLAGGKLVAGRKGHGFLHELNSFIKTPHLAVVHALGHQGICQTVLDELHLLLGSRGLGHHSQSVAIELHSITITPGRVCDTGFLHLLQCIAQGILTTRCFLSRHRGAARFLSYRLGNQRQCNG